MGIYIKGMSLCQFANLFQYDCMVEWHPPKDGEVCQLCGRDVVEVLEPHGRLIDVDACIDYIRNNNQHAWEALAYAPIVIEGSE